MLSFVACNEIGCPVSRPPIDQDIAVLGTRDLERSTAFPVKTRRAATPRCPTRKAHGRAILAVVAVAVAVAGCRVALPRAGDARPKADLSPDTDQLGEVVPVVGVGDGDSIRVIRAGKEERVRLIGIDAPEMADETGRPECFAREAAERLRELLRGRTVRLEGDPTQGERDRHGRLLAYVWLDEHAQANLIMVEDGFAYEYTYGRGYRYRDAYQAAERRAQSADLGLWAPGACGGPAGSTAIMGETK